MRQRMLKHHRLLQIIRQPPHIKTHQIIALTPSHKTLIMRRELQIRETQTVQLFRAEFGKQRLSDIIDGDIPLSCAGKESVEVGVNGRDDLLLVGQTPQGAVIAGVLVKEDEVTPRGDRILVVPEGEGTQVVFSAKSAEHVEAGGAVAVEGVEVVVGHDDGVPFAVVAAVLGPDGFCALFEISVVAV